CGDGVIQAPEVCDDGNDDHGDACLDTSAVASCGDGFVQDGVEDCDDGNNVSNDGCAADCTGEFPAVCTTGNDPGTNSPWVVCSADANQAWISANTGGNFHPIVICQSLGYNTVGQWGGTCGNVCGYCQGATSCMNTGSMQFDFGNWNGSGNCGADAMGPIICNTVHWTCVN
ncbi:MAG: DUF4215 domain-containing protein, partial [Myxococcales bacterium]|nr:DUF4215 domain-containing protein [Myxococcales bacterium]